MAGGCVAVESICKAHAGYTPINNRNAMGNRYSTPERPRDKGGRLE